MRSNLYLIIGEDKKIIDFNIFSILEKIDYNENNKIIYDMSNDKFIDVIEEASMISMFSPVKVIVVNNFSIDILNEKEFEYLEKFINSKNKDIYIILISNKVDARKKSYKIFKDNFKIIETTNTTDNELYDYVYNKVNENKYIIDKINVEYFINKVGNDINNINNELQKLFIYKKENKKILREDIDLLVFNNIDNVIYEFTNAILDEDYNKIKRMYNKFIIDNISIDYLISSVAGSFRNSLIIKLLSNKNMNNYEIGKVIVKKEYYVKKSLERLYKYSTNDLVNYINKLAVIDKNIKTSKDFVGKFDLFIFNKEN